MQNIRVIVGLGNIGPEYVKTRHNAGFWFIDRVVDKYNVNMHYDNKFCADLGKFNCHNTDVFVLKPQTYMNLSGQSVATLLNFFKISASQVLVVHDDLDFVPGIIRLKVSNTSHGGHNGLKNINQVVQQDYWRMRIGIGRPQFTDQVTAYVLKTPTQEHRQLINDALERGMQILELLIQGEFNEAMKQLHTDEA